MTLSILSYPPRGDASPAVCINYAWMFFMRCPVDDTRCWHRGPRARAEYPGTPRPTPAAATPPGADYRQAPLRPPPPLPHRRSGAPPVVAFAYRRVARACHRDARWAVPPAAV